MYSKLYSTYIWLFVFFSKYFF